MLPESEAPPLAHYEEFKAFMAERKVRVMREYVLPHDESEMEPYWVTWATKETVLPDDRIICQMIQIPDSLLDQAVAWKEAWEMEADLLVSALTDRVHRETAPRNPLHRLVPA